MYQIWKLSITFLVQFSIFWELFIHNKWLNESSCSVCPIMMHMTHLYFEVDFNISACSLDGITAFLCRLRSIAAHRDHFVRSPQCSRIFIIFHSPMGEWEVRCYSPRQFFHSPRKKNVLKYVMCYSNTIPHPGIPLLAYYMYIYIPPDALSLYTEVIAALWSSTSMWYMDGLKYFIYSFIYFFKDFSCFYEWLVNICLIM